MRVQVFTDAWHPQINGVVRTLTATRDVLVKQGHAFNVVSPQLFKNYPCPTYPEIRLAWKPARKIDELVEEFRPEAIHIATEGPIGWAARAYCLQRQLPFSSAYHTRFPEYVKARTGLPRRWLYKMLRYFHWPSEKVMVPTPSIRDNLAERGFRNLALWTRGVDTQLFKPQPRDNKLFADSEGPLFLYVGRVAVEKNLEAFLGLRSHGRKVVVGDGPQLQEYRNRYPRVLFTGSKMGEELSQYYAAADVFVFPSLTDTFGLVLLEALASGVPVAAFPVTGPIDVIQNPEVGALDVNLEKAVNKALGLSRDKCRKYAQQFSWENAAAQFMTNLHWI